MSESISSGGGAVLLIKFEGERVLTTDVINLLEAIEAQLKDDEVEEVRQLCADLEIHDTLRDAVLYRLDKTHVDRSYIEAVTLGSFEILAVIAASALFVLEKTIGESVKAGYIRSDLHERIREWVSAQINNKLNRLATSLPGHWRLGGRNLQISVDEKAHSMSLTVPERLSDEDRAPPLGQLALPAPPSALPPSHKS